MGERPTPDAPHPGKRRPPRAPSCRPNSAQSQRAVGFVTGSHARTPLHPQPVGSRPWQPAQKAGSWGGRAPDPGRPTPRQEAPPPGSLMPPPMRAKPARCGVGDGSPRPHPPHTHSQLVVGPGSPPRGRAVGGGRAPNPGRPRPRQEAPPPGTLVLPPQLARAHAVGLVTGPHARTPRTHS